MSYIYVSCVYTYVHKYNSMRYFEEEILIVDQTIDLNIQKS